MSTLSGRNWLPVNAASRVNPGSTRKHRYSSVPPLGAAGVYACGMDRLTKRSPARSGAAGGGLYLPCPWALADPAGPA